MEKPFINPRTLAVHFPTDKESRDGTDDVVRDLDRDSDSVQLDDFDLLSPIEQLESLAKTLERVYTLSTQREPELERDEPLPTLAEYYLL